MVFQYYQQYRIRRYLQLQQIKHDWYGAPCTSAGFDIAYNNGEWVFSVCVDMPAREMQLAKPGEYFEGLWKQDVAEWFVYSPDNNRYLECNLSANGAWWLMAFSKPRVRDTSGLAGIDLSLITTRHHIEKAKWGAELHIPETVLCRLLGASHRMYNVCFILGTPQQYLSLNRLSSLKPDFHRPAEFKTLLFSDRKGKVGWAYAEGE